MPGYVAGEQIWAGFPYQSNEAMAEDLQKFLDPIFFTSTDQLEPGSSIVFMTHNGPRESCTCYGGRRGFSVGSCIDNERLSVYNFISEKDVSTGCFHPEED